MYDPFLPACDSAGRRTFDVILVRSLRVFRLNNVIDSLFDNLRQEMLEPSSVKFSAGWILASPAFDHDIRYVTVIPLHYARNLVPVLEAAATDAAGKFRPITLNKKRPVLRCK